MNSFAILLVDPQYAGLSGRGRAILLFTYLQQIEGTRTQVLASQYNVSPTVKDGELFIILWHREACFHNMNKKLVVNYLNGLRN